MPDRFLREFASDVAPFLAPSFGALLGLRWASEQTPLQKLSAWIFGFGLGVYFGAAAGEVFSLGPKATIAAGILIAIIGVDVLGGVVVAAKAFGKSPLETFKGWWSAWKGQP